MLQIKPQQIGAFSAARQSGFEAEMRVHLREFLPGVARGAGDDGLAQAIRNGARRARRHGFTQRGPVRLYLEMMVLLGSRFDTDPQYPWAAQVLGGAADDVSERQRAQELHHRFTRYLAVVGGPDDPPAAAARSLARDLSHRTLLAGDSAMASLVRLAQWAYPEKAGAVGPEGLSALADTAIEQAAVHGLVAPRQVTLVFGLMLAFGHGCLDDPLHPWIAETLASPGAGPGAGDRADRLEAQALQRLGAPVAEAKEAG